MDSLISCIAHSINIYQLTAEFDTINLILIYIL